MKSVLRNSLIEKTFRHLKTVWKDPKHLQNFHIQDLNGDREKNAGVIHSWVDSCLDPEGGEFSARKKAVALGRTYLEMTAEQQLQFMQVLATEYGVDEQRISGLYENWMSDTSNRHKTAIELRSALQPPRVKLLRLFNELTEGVKFLVDLRAQLIGLRKDHPELVPLEKDLKHLLESWFDIGLLQLERITWSSSAEILEKLIDYEAVHQITSWADLKNRLDSDRRCFAFFHPSMPNEPLIFVEVALVDGISDNVQALLDEEAPVIDPNEANSAIFYSISNAQQGLSGISFGNVLIKRVVQLLKQEYPQLTHFSTLSPIPKLTKWINSLPEEEIETLPLKQALKASTPITKETAQSLSLNPDNRSSLIALAEHYLSDVKRRDGYAYDPVAHFHLSNGAKIERINFHGDQSDKGIKESLSLMVNYLYETDQIDERSRDYLSLQKISKSKLK